MKNKIKYIKMLIKKEIPLRDRDITGTPLLPGNSKHCKGNGKHSGYPLCCDECSYLSACEELDEYPRL